MVEYERGIEEDVPPGVPQDFIEYDILSPYGDKDIDKHFKGERWFDFYELPQFNSPLEYIPKDELIEKTGEMNTGHDGVAGIIIPDWEEIYLSNREVLHHPDLAVIIEETNDEGFDDWSNLDAILFRLEFTSLGDLPQNVVENILGIGLPSNPDVVSERINKVSIGRVAQPYYPVQNLLMDTYVPSAEMPVFALWDMLVKINEVEITTTHLYNVVRVCHMMGMPNNTIFGYKHQPRGSVDDPSFFNLSDLYDRANDGGVDLPKRIIDRDERFISTKAKHIRGEFYEIL